MKFTLNDLLAIPLNDTDTGLCRKGYIAWVSQDRENGKAILVSGVAQGDAKCACYFASTLESEGDVEHSAAFYQRAFPLLKDAADKGDSEACAMVGAYYEGGFIGSTDIKLAERYFQKGLQIGGDYAVFRYGKGIFRGIYPDIDDYEKTGVEMMQSVAAHDPSYAFELGLLLLLSENARSVYPNHEKVGLYYLKKAADADQAGACYFLALFLTEGKYCPRDVEAALQYSQKARLLGHGGAEKIEKSLSLALRVKRLFSFGKSGGKRESFANMISDIEEVLPECSGMFAQAGKAMQATETIDRVNELAKSPDINDKKQAVAELEQLIADNPMYEKTHDKLLERLYGEISEAVSEDENFDCQFLLHAAEKGNARARFFLGICYYEGRGIPQDYEKALYCFRKSLDSGMEEGMSCFYIANCYAFGYGLPQNEQKATEYYGKAMEYGVNCQYALDSIQYHQPGYTKADGMQEYAERILRRTQTAATIYAAVKQDVEESFSPLWQKVPENAQVSIITGVNAYISFYAMVKEAAAECDFSVVINSISKALETVLAKVFYTDYILFLKSSGLDVKAVKGLRNYAVKTAQGKYLYPDERDISLFSLGGARHIFDVQGLKLFLEQGDVPPILQYADQIFNKSEFPAKNRKKAIAEYLISLADEVLTIKEYRNPASHGKVMTRKDAEVCVDTLVLVKKIILELLKKI